jgi:ribosomal protein L11 methylase PrmA
VICGSLEAVRPQVFDLLLANLTIGVITGLAPAFPEIVRPGGLAVLSGFTTGQVGEVLRALGRGEVLQELSLEGWAGLLVRF